jgi:myosin heavy subunit
LETLISELENTEPLFIQCIRPNEQKSPNLFDRSCVLRQLRNLGIIQTTAIRRSGYSSRHDYKKFVETYYGLVPGLG